MDIGSVFLVLALAVLVALFIGQPFFRSMLKKAPEESAQAAELDHQWSGLLAERDRLLLALQELDFDYGLGKIPEVDYPTQRAQLLQHAAGVLKALDEIEGQQGDLSAEVRVEQAVAARRADSGLQAPAPTVQPAVQASASAATMQADSLEEIIARRRAKRKEKSGGFCPKCGRPVTRSDKFCSGCGNLL